jgi:hypothetical protein
MATNSTTERRSLYPPEHPRKRQRYYFDDTLDAYPPLRRLFPGKPTPEAVEAARQLAANRGYPMPHVPTEDDDSRGSQDAQGAAAPAGSPALVDGAPTRRLKKKATPPKTRKG